jgi:hypothetical protein
MNPKVDPAALLLAVLALGITTLTGSGAWSYINTVSAAVVGVIVVTYTWPDKQTIYRTREPSRPTNFNYRAIIAQSTVYGFIFAIGIAWPVQELIKPPGCDDKDSQSNWTACILQTVEPAQIRALIIGLLLAIVAFICLSALTNKRGFRWLNRLPKHIFRWLKRPNKFGWLKHIFGWLTRRGANQRNDPS